MALSLLGSHVQGSQGNRDKYLLKTKGQMRNVFVSLGIEGRIVPPSRGTQSAITTYKYIGLTNIEFLLEAHDKATFFCFFGSGFHKPVLTKVMKITHRQMQAWRSGPMME